MESDATTECTVDWFLHNVTALESLGETRTTDSGAEVELKGRFRSFVV